MADGIRGQGVVRIVRNAQLTPGYRLPNYHERCGLSIAGRGGLDRLADGQRVASHRDSRVTRAWRRKSCGQAGFGEAINRKHCRPRQPVWGHRAKEFFAQLHGYRFGAVKKNAHGLEIKCRGFVGLECFQKVPVAEIRRAEDRCLLFTGLREPQLGAAHECRGRHQVVRNVHDERRQVKADQSHVVRQRHPAQPAVRFGEVDALRDRGNIREQIVVGERHAFRLAGRARRVLDERDVIGHRRVWLARSRNVVDAVNKNRLRFHACQRGFHRSAGGKRRKTRSEFFHRYINAAP